jgi:hypothetical protein
VSFKTVCSVADMLNLRAQRNLFAHIFMDLSKIPITDFLATSLNNNGLLEYPWRKFLSVLSRT